MAKFKENGKLKLLIIVGTRPEICDGLYSENELRAVHVVKEDKPNFTYLTTLCEDCIKYNRSYGVLVKEKYLMIEPSKF